MKKGNDFRNENKYISTAPWGSELLRRRHNAHDLFLTELSKHEICTGTKQIHLSQATCNSIVANNKGNSTVQA